MRPLSLLMGETCHLVGWQVPPFVKPVTLGDYNAAEKGLLLQGDFSPPVCCVQGHSSGPWGLVSARKTSVCCRFYALDRTQVIVAKVNQQLRQDVLTLGHETYVCKYRRLT